MEAAAEQRRADLREREARARGLFDVAVALQELARREALGIRDARIPFRGIPNLYPRSSLAPDETQE